MNEILRILIGLFLIAHGLVHTGLAVAPRPDVPGAPIWTYLTTRSWLLDRLGVSPKNTRAVGTALFAAATLGFVLAGLAFLGAILPQSAWPFLTGVSALVSLVLLALFWHRSLVYGVGINVVLMAAAWVPGFLKN